MDRSCGRLLIKPSGVDYDTLTPEDLVEVDLESGEVIERRWNNWLNHDPINLVAKYRADLKTLHGIYIDCGWRDQYQIHYGTRILSKRLATAGIRHTYEEFDDNHSDIDYRMDVSLPYLYRSLKP